MTNEQWNTLNQISPLLIAWEKNQFFKSREAQEQKPRIEWLIQEFGLQPINWGCSGCVKNRLTTLYKIYARESEQRKADTNN